MALLDKWRSVAYNEKLGKNELQRLWGVYFKHEQDIREFDSLTPSKMPQSL